MIDIRTVKVYRATEDGFIWKTGEVVAIDWYAYDAPIGWNLDTGRTANIFEANCWEQIQWANLTKSQKEYMHKNSLICR